MFARTKAVDCASRVHKVTRAQIRGRYVTGTCSFESETQKKETLFVFCVHFIVGIYFAYTQ